ncbi:FtsL-like putative cell division protein [Pedobacter sp.]|uniref:FtsL-like putative cell division protein n=1 Tax=Pedobacter sp. TaxID=1411316 RepID=UPI003D7F3970
MNQFLKNTGEEPEQQDEPQLKSPRQKKVKKPETGNAFKRLLTDGVITKEAATEMLPFLLFISFLCMLYIANSHMAVKNIRDIDKLNKEVKELSWEYKSLKADLMFKSKLTEVAKKVDTLGIRELVVPPKKLIITNDEH